MMSTINYSQVQKFGDENRSIETHTDITLQPAGVAKLFFEYSDFRRFKETNMPEYTNILVAEALMIIQIVKPSLVSIKNADAVDCSRWWKELKQPFGDGQLERVRFVISGIRDSLKLNMDVLTPVVQEVVEMLASKKPIAFYIRVTEHRLIINSVSQKTIFCPKVKNTFDIELIGDWNWRYTYAKLLADVLPDQFCNLRKVYLVFDFECQTCVNRAFEKMNWTFPETHKDTWDFISKQRKSKWYFDRYAWHMQKYNEFKLEATNTKIWYFFHPKPAVC